MSNFIYLDELSQDDKLLKSELHRFAAEVIRPASIKLDKMNRGDIIKPDSPYFEVMRQIRRLGYHKLLLPQTRGGPGLTPSQAYIVAEEMAWGSVGLATAWGVDMLPFTVAANSDELYKEFVVPWMEDTAVRFHGCWGITEPAHGSDYLIALREEEELVRRFGRAQVVAERSGDGWIINGQKSGWVSSGPVCTHVLLHAQLKDANSFLDGIAAIVPTESRGASRGRPMDMLGLRDMPQGPLSFEGVHIPARYVIAGPGPFYKVFLDQLLNSTSIMMGAFGVGLARAAFEEALNYARARIQGGVPLVRHKNIKLKLYEMYEKIETARYYIRKAFEYVYRARMQGYGVPPRVARTAQIYGKKVAFEVAHEALQIFGAYGLNKEFIVEKLFRDARSMLIEDGTVEVLSLDVAEDIIQNYEKDYYDISFIYKDY